jgi:hypothetical protein
VAARQGRDTARPTEHRIVEHTDEPAPREAHVPLPGDKQLRQTVERISARLAKPRRWSRRRRENER